MAGIDTLAIEVSSTFMKVASDSAMVPIASFEPLSGGSPAGAPAGAPPATGLSAFSADMAFILGACPARRFTGADDAPHRQTAPSPGGRHPPRHAPPTRAPGPTRLPPRAPA